MRMRRSGFRLVLLAAGLVALAFDLVLARGWTQLLVQLTMVLLVAAGVLGIYFHFHGSREFQLEMDPQMRGTDSGVARAAGEVAADARARLDDAVGHSGSRLCLSKENTMKHYECDTCDGCDGAVLFARSLLASLCAGGKVTRRRRREYGNGTGARWRRRT